MPQEPDWDQLLFSNPAGTIKRIKAEAVADARKILHQDYAQLTNREKWERMFYGASPHLRAHRELVEAAMVEVSQELPANTPVAEANAEIERRVEARLKHQERFGEADRERALWSGGPGFDGPAPSVPMATQTLGDTIKARRDVRREAAHGTRVGGRS
jgi:hypothetical protein